MFTLKCFTNIKRRTTIKELGDYNDKSSLLTFSEECACNLSNIALNEALPLKNISKNMVSLWNYYDSTISIPICMYGRKGEHYRRFILSGGIKKIDYRIGKMYMFDAKKFFNNVSRGIVSR